MKKHILIAAAIAAMGLTACGSSTTAPAPGVVSLSGVVSKGPISAGIVTVVDSAKHTYTTTTDAYGAYNLPLDVYAVGPYTLTVKGGIDGITGKAQDFPVSTVVTNPTGAGIQIDANVNVFSTVVAAAAKAAAGGQVITASGLKAQEVAVVKSLGMGLPAGVSPLSDVSAANAGKIASANEALAEVIRRSTVVGNKAGVPTTTADLQDSMAALAADISDGALDGKTTQTALTSAGASAAVTPTTVVTKTAEVAKETTKVVLEAATQGGAVNVTDVYTGVTTVDSYVTAKKVLDIAVKKSITTVLTAQGKTVGTIAAVAAPSAAAVVAQTSASTAVVTNVVKTATTNADAAVALAAKAGATPIQVAAAKTATADAYTAAQAATTVTADNYTAATTFVTANPTSTVAVSLQNSASATQASTATLVTATGLADSYAQGTITGGFAAAQTVTAVAVTTATTTANTATTTANTAATVAAPVVLKAFVLGGNSLTYSGQAAASTVDVYGKVTAPAAAMLGSAITLSGTLRDLTGLGARTIVTSFEFGVQQVGGSRLVKASINPVNIVVNTAGDVRVNVPAGAVITYSYVNAAGTGFNGTASNIAANNGIIVSNAGAFTVNVSTLSNIITAKTNAGLNILATVGTFNYTAGFTNVAIGHESATGAVDSLFAIDTAVTGTRALQGTFTTK
ncbi:MAG: hypothetical protein COA61_006760 [Zetaproteobacteria bacterium]|nr:hypothetical protein [Zetaproteobacteria bacterium]